MTGFIIIPSLWVGYGTNKLYFSQPFSHILYYLWEFNSFMALLVNGKKVYFWIYPVSVDLPW